MPKTLFYLFNQLNPYVEELTDHATSNEINDWKHSNPAQVDTLAIGSCAPFIFDFFQALYLRMPDRYRNIAGYEKYQVAFIEVEYQRLRDAVANARIDENNALLDL
jgi:hypothetical protein